MRNTWRNDYPAARKLSWSAQGKHRAWKCQSLEYDGAFMGISREILENGFSIEYTDMYNQKSVAMFLPSEPHEWDVYDLDRYGYHKVGSMPQVGASNIDIIRLASGGEPNGTVFAL